MKPTFYFSLGTKQTDRIVSALLPGFVQIDEQTDRDTIHFIEQFSSILQFYNLQNDPEGTWQNFFQQDLSFLLAAIGHTDLSGFHDEFRSLINQFNASPLNSSKEQVLIELLKLTLRLIGNLLKWYQAIHFQRKKNDDYQEIDEMILELYKANIWKGAGQLRHCYKSMLYTFNQNPNWLAHEDLESNVNRTQAQLWQTLGRSFFDLRNSSFLDRNTTFVFERHADFFSYLTELFESVYSTASVLQQKSQSFLAQSLLQSNHTPQVSLLFALQAMMEPTRELLNGYVQRHLNFYYRQVLLQKPAPAIPDQVPVHFQMNPAYQESFHPQGTALVAGTDATGNPIVYKTTRDLTVTPAKIVALMTLFNGTIRDDKKNNILPYLLAAPKADSGDGKGGPFIKQPAAWSTLGAGLPEKQGSRPLPNLARLGFAFSSAYLLLSDGQRILSLTLDIDPQTLSDLNQKWRQQYPIIPLESFLEEVFSISYSSPQGWTAPSQVQVLTSYSFQNSSETGTGMAPGQETGTGMEWSSKDDGLESGLTFTITIASDQPPVVPYNSKIHGLGYQTHDPLLRFNLIQKVVKPAELEKSGINPYSWLANLGFRGVYLETIVQDASQFIAQNDFSVLKTQSPFAVFGDKPVLGNNFYIGNSEIFAKPLSELIIEIEWYDLPKFPTGFCEYYAMYNRFHQDQPFNNAVFTWHLNLLLNNSWVPIPIEMADDFTLWNTDVNSGPISSDSTGIIPAPESKRLQQPIEELSVEQAKKLLFHFIIAHQAIPNLREALPALETGFSSGGINNATSSGNFNLSAPMFVWYKASQEQNASDKILPTPADIHETLDKTNNVLTQLRNDAIPHELFKKILSSEIKTGTTDLKINQGLEDLIQGVKNSSILSSMPISTIASALNTSEDEHRPIRKELESILSAVVARVFPASQTVLPDKPDKKKSGLSGIFQLVIMLLAQRLKIPFSALKGIFNHKKNQSTLQKAPTPMETPAVETIFPKQDLLTKDTGSTPERRSNPEIISTACPTEAQGVLKSKSIYRCHLDQISWDLKAASVPFSPKMKFGEQSSEGFLRFTLDQPTYAFGHELYPRVLSEVANENIQLMSGRAINSGADKGATDSKPSPKEKSSSQNSDGAVNTGLSTGSQSTEDGSKEEPPKHQKREGLWKVFDGVTGLLSLVFPVARLVKKAGDAVHKTASEIDQQLDKYRSVKTKAAIVPPDTTKNSLLLPPRPAYTPKIKNLKISYRASQRIDFSKRSNGHTAILNFFHLDAFGITAHDLESCKMVSLLPVYNRQGYLYVGLEKLSPPQELSLMFVFDEASGNRDKNPPPIIWSYWKNGNWVDFSPLAVQDGTQGFLQSGLILFNLPLVAYKDKGPFTDQTKPDAGKLYWLRATAGQAADAVCNTVKIYPHAAIATYAGGLEKAPHLKAPLPVGKIKNLQDLHPKINKIVQAVPSSGGKTEESDVQFFTRVQERLRHKDRAITAWDYEHLVLNGFPSIGLVRCLNHTLASDHTTSLPGAVTVVIMPAKISSNENPLAPKTNQSLLLEVSEYLSPRIDPFLQLEVRNPDYVFLRVNASIKFQAGLNSGKLLNQLNQGLIEKIAPWNNDYQQFNPFEYSLNYFTLLEYLNHQPFVENVIEFRISLLTGQNKILEIDISESFKNISPDYPWIIVSSVPKHDLRDISDNNISSERTLPVAANENPDLKSLSSGGSDSSETGIVHKDISHENYDTGQEKVVIVPTAADNALYIRSE
ncbi:baseplate J/gp47 family protein [Flavilitoribacter nigricans]|uniref:Baseplate protein J-like domain-containing protein n=1 Tax=Flavilitoribacter nigricans (strain ATCC 23147 / DSM 23189 / NBRC 102662 / NCIMB 1420 / SS-2) TaxID=1122177 RepID=A0A2D0N392_FLAN2|nr:hypothetical protein [Flavilitoribacter nigricans]PHN02223.1 hypothetical protein CRP01_33350 [Flavilitoribacter nigricans DSM 23189 = NBRC 102662]